MQILLVLNDPPYGTERCYNGLLLLCGTCMDARGLADTGIMAGARRSNMAELADATLVADKVLVF